MKSTQRYKPARHTSRYTRLLALLGGLLLLCSLLLPASALAAPRSAAAVPPLTKPQQIVDLAGVSVVRLWIGYFIAGTWIDCTALGTVIASWPPQNANDNNNWVLTDGLLLNTSTNNACAPGGKLGEILVYASNEFTNNQPPTTFGYLTCTGAAVCTDTLAGGAPGPVESLLTPVNNAVLFSFHTSNPLPYIDVEKARITGNSTLIPIELANSNNTFPSSVKIADLKTLEQFLTPSADATTTGSTPAVTATASTHTIEPGMPLIDGNGKIAAMKRSNTIYLLSTGSIANLEKLIPLPTGTTLAQKLATNTLSQQWDSGIIQYEQGNYQEAIRTLNSIQNAPPTFQAPAAFIALAREKLSSNGSTSSSIPSSHEASNSGFSPWLILIGLIVGGVALILLLLFVAIRFGRKRVERKREQDSFEADIEKAQQRVEGKEKPVAAPQQYLPSPPYGGAASYPPAPAQNIDPTTNISPVPGQPIIAAPPTQNRVQPQQSAPAPQMQDDPAIQAALQRLWDRAGH